MKRFHSILVTNDDGISAPGIIRTARLACELAEEVYVVAPASQCSAMSQRITIFEPMKLSPCADFPVPGVKAYSLTGSPADCVKAALLFPICQPDMVFSGVNHGLNTGLDISYSGTVGACFEALSKGIPAIAFSKTAEGSYDVTDRYMSEITYDILERGISASELWNINFPGCSVSELKGILHDRRPASLQLYEDYFYKEALDDGSFILQQRGKPMETSDAVDGTDIHAALNNFISVGKIRHALL